MTIIRAFLDETITDERWFLDQLTERAWSTSTPKAWAASSS